MKIDKEVDKLREMCIQQGWVPSGCTLDGFLIMALTRSQNDPCKGCYHDRDICKGRPRNETI
jgi:hypothetical protein